MSSPILSKTNPLKNTTFFLALAGWLAGWLAAAAGGRRLLLRVRCRFRGGEAVRLPQVPGAVGVADHGPERHVEALLLRPAVHPARPARVLVRERRGGKNEEGLHFYAWVMPGDEGWQQRRARTRLGFVVIEGGVLK